MKFNLLYLAMYILIACIKLNGQVNSNKPIQYDTIYLLHLKNYESWPWKYELSSNDSPRYVLSQDTMHFEVNQTFRYSSPGIKKARYFNHRIDVDVVAVHFPKGDTIVVRFRSIETSNKNVLPLQTGTLDTTLQITATYKNDFYFASYRFIPKSGSRPNKFYWRIFSNENTRKKLTLRLQKRLTTDIVYTIKVE